MPNDIVEHAVIPAPQTPTLDALMSFTEFTLLTGILSPGTREAYRYALQRFFIWYRDYMTREGAKFDRTAILTHMANLQDLASSTRNGALAAIKRLARELYYKHLISFETWEGIKDIKSEVQQSRKAPNWLTEKQLDELMRLPKDDAHGRRDRVILAVLAGCGLRRQELCNLDLDDMEQRAGRWVFIVHGKGDKTRFTPIPNGVKVCIDDWLDVRGLLVTGGDRTTLPKHLYLVCPVWQGDVIKDRQLSDDAIYDIVRGYGVRLGFPKLAPHDLRRTYARLTRELGGDLDQIQFSMGHANVATTQKYIGDNQRLDKAPGDLLETNWTGEKL